MIVSLALALITCQTAKAEAELDPDLKFDVCDVSFLLPLPDLDAVNA